MQIFRISGKNIKSTNINNCINRDKCIGCKKSYHLVIYITKTGLGFCSIECMENFISKWRIDDDSVTNYFEKNTNALIESMP